MDEIELARTENGRYLVAEVDPGKRTMRPATRTPSRWETEARLRVDNCLRLWFRFGAFEADLRAGERRLPPTMFCRILNACERPVYVFKGKRNDLRDIAVMAAVILVLMVGTIRLIGGNANNVFSEAASSIQ